jgi:hypothetical protein
MKIFKLYGERVIGCCINPANRSIKMNACCTHPFYMEPMTDYIDKSEIHIATSHIRDIVLCMAFVVRTKIHFPG